jgi:hypothetical protein
VKRRAFITLIGSAATWPLAARAQQGERVRRIGVLAYWADDDAEGQSSKVRRPPICRLCNRPSSSLSSILWRPGRSV